MGSSCRTWRSVASARPGSRPRGSGSASPRLAVPCTSTSGETATSGTNLDAAYATGIRSIDVARSYGDAEAFLGAWLEVRDPSDVVVGSKWGYTYVGLWRLDAGVQEVKDLSVDALRRQIAESRQLLGDRLSLYQIHSATIESGVFDDHEVLDELRSLRESGLFLGFSTTGPNQADAIARGIQERVDGEPLFSTIQSTWNVMEPSAGPALAEAHAAGRGVLIKEALANGRLAAPDGPLGGIAGRLGTTPDRVALATALAHPWVDVVLSGINLGPNIGSGMWHSGTLAAAKQAALLGLRGIALSTPTGETEPDFDRLRPWVSKVLHLLLESSHLSRRLTWLDLAGWDLSDGGFQLLALCPPLKTLTHLNLTNCGLDAEGMAALLAMLNSCAANVSVVNIDNGFSAGFVAALIARQSHAARSGKERPREARSR